MEKRVFSDRFRVHVPPFMLAEFTNEDGGWHESRADVEAALAWGREKARLLRWVREQMRRRLTPKQRRCIDLHFFQGRSFAEIQEVTGLSPSSISRIIQRGIGRLRVAARVDPPRPAPRGLGNLGIERSTVFRKRSVRAR